MPYIPQSRRDEFNCRSGLFARNIGELTYLLYKTATDYGHEEDYAGHSQVIAALDNAKEEYRRQYLNPYEDRKREENGPV